MKDIKDLDLKELEEILMGWGERPFHARQIFSWIYKKGVTDFEAMSDLPSDLRRSILFRITLKRFSVVRKVFYTFLHHKKYWGGGRVHL